MQVFHKCEFYVLTVFELFRCFYIAFVAAGNDMAVCLSLLAGFTECLVISAILSCSHYQKIVFLGNKIFLIPFDFCSSAQCCYLAIFYNIMTQCMPCMVIKHHVNSVYSFPIKELDKPIFNRVGIFFTVSIFPCNYFTF